MRRWACNSLAATLAVVSVSASMSLTRHFGEASGPQRGRNTSAPQHHRRERNHHNNNPNRNNNISNNTNRRHHMRGPIKDRYPPMAVDLSDPRRRLAVLIDGTNLNLISESSSSSISSNNAVVDDIMRSSSLFNNVLPAVHNVGVPVLLRVFGYQLPSAWEPLLVGSSDGSRSTEGGGNPSHSSLLTIPSSSSSSRPAEAAESAADAAPPAHSSKVQIEFFRVERFIPIPMQIEADAMHIYDFRHMNKIEGVCYICHEVDRGLYESLMDQQSSEEAGCAGGSTTSFFNQYVMDEFGLVKERTVDGRPGNGTQ